jgi:DNA-binding XRE family transcriptional regulator
MLDKRICQLRQKCDLSLGEAARKIGVPLADYSRIERGALLPVGPLVAKMAEAFCCSEEDVRNALPTASEVEAESKRIEESYDRLSKALGAVQADAKAKGYKRGNGGRGSIKCPCCDSGTLRYSVAGVNGHIWGACSDESCVRWMQ